MTDAWTELAVSAAERTRLQRGEVVQRTPGKGALAGDAPLGLVVLPVPVAPAWQLLSQWERIHEVLPALRFQVARESLDESGLRRALVVCEVRVPWVALRYMCQVTFRASLWRQEWSLVPAEELALLSKDRPSLPRNSRMIREATGSMQLHPCQEGCLLVYRSRIALHRGVPRALEAVLTKQLVHEFLSGLRAYPFERADQATSAAAGEHELSRAVRLENHSSS